MGYRYRRGNKRWRSRRNDPVEAAFGFLAIGFGLAVIASVNTLVANIGPALTQLFLVLLSTVLILGLFVGPIFALVYLHKKLDRNSTSNDTSAISGRLNRHGCRCYLEDLDEGEALVANSLAEALDYKDYYIFNNIKLPNAFTGTSQIDHIVVSKFGVFLIETKSWHGLVLGNRASSQWVRYLGHAKEKFPSPIKQSYAHERALTSLVPNVLTGKVFKLILFPYADLKGLRLDGVSNIDDGIRFIRTFSREILTTEEVALVVGELSLLCQTFHMSNEQHVANLHAARMQKKSRVNI